MLRLLLQSSTVSAFLMFSSLAQAQVDIGTQLLLDPGSSSASSEEMSIRLVRKSPPKKLPAKTAKPKSQAEAPVKETVQVNPNSNELDRLIFGKTKFTTTTSTSTTASTTTSTSTTLPVTTTTQVPKAVVSKPSPVKLVPNTEVPLQAQTPVVPPPSADAAPEEPSQEFTYVEQVHPDDQRLNQLEIQVQSGVMATDSRANHSVRDYRIFSPQLQFGANVWLEPTIGLSGSYSMSLAADVSGGVGSADRYSLRQEKIEVGMNFRQFFGLSRKATSIEYGVQFFESKFDVSADATSRIRTKTSGLGVHIGARLPSSPSYNWTLGAELYPRLQHTEMNTASTYRSGSSPETSQIRIDVGGELKFSRSHVMTWSINWTFEKSRFSGAANELDPRTGATPSGVSVESTTTGLNFGYRWGQ